MLDERTLYLNKHLDELWPGARVLETVPVVSLS
jgi:hypothetical protein